MSAATIARPGTGPGRPPERQPARAEPTLDLPRLALLALSLALTLPVTSAYFLDLAGLTLRAAPLAAAVAAQAAVAALALARVQAGPVALRPTRLLGLALTFAVALAVGLRFAWPSLLPVSDSVDEVNNYLLADYIVRHATLPRGDEAASLVEMGQYPFGPDLLAALGARMLALPAYYVLHPLAAVLLAATAAFAYGIVAERVASRPGGDLAALAALVVLLWPAAYTLGQFTNDFFLAQMFGQTCLIGALYWAGDRSPAALVGLIALGAGLVFSYPTLLPIFGLGIALARPRWRDLAVVGLPTGLLAALYLLARAGEGLAVVRQGGVALAPSLETLPPLFLALALAGLALASRRPTALAWFAWAALLQTAAFALIYGLTGELSRYAVEKMVYVLVPLLAVLAAALLAGALTTGRPGALATRQVALLALLVASAQVGPRLARPVGERVPTAALTSDLVAAAAWLRERAPDQAPLYLTSEHLPAYWVEFGLLKRDRTAEALPRFHDRVRPPGQRWAWRAAPGQPDLALLTRDADALIGPDVLPLLRAGNAAVIARGPDGGGGRPPYRWVGDDLVVTGAALAAPRAAPGAALRVEVELGVVARPLTDYALVARLRDWAGQVRGEAQQVVGGGGLTAGGRASAALTLPLDRSLPRGAYRVELLTFRLPAWDLVPSRIGPAPEALEAPVVIAPVLVVGSDGLPPVDAVPARPIGARFGDQVELVGAERPRLDGRTVELDLVWRALRPVERDYSVFVHLVDEAGRVVAQADGFAWEGALPTSAWPVGQPLLDRRRLALPGPGPYRLRVGLYRLDTGERLPTGGVDSAAVDLRP